MQYKPDDDRAWERKGDALSKLEKYGEAVDSYDKALQYKPDDDRAWENKGDALYYLGKYAESLKSYNTALQYNPDDDWALYQIACIYGLQNNVPLALENLQKAIKLDSKYRDTAKTDPDFDLIREQPEFQELLTAKNFLIF